VNNYKYIVLKKVTNSITCDLRPAQPTKVNKRFDSYEIDKINVKMYHDNVVSKL
jgi:hypothetical protein